MSSGCIADIRFTITLWIWCHLHDLRFDPKEACTISNCLKGTLAHTTRKDHTSHMEGRIPLHLSFCMSSGKYVRISLHTFESHDQLTFSWVIIVTCSILNVMNMNMSGMFPQFVTSPHSVSKSLHTNVRILTLLDKSIVVSLLLRVFNFTHKSIISSLSCLQDA